MANLDHLGMKTKRMCAPILCPADNSSVWDRTRADAGTKLILADEPVASLDPVLAHSILKYLELMNKETQDHRLVQSPLSRSCSPLRDARDCIKDGVLVSKDCPKEIDDAQFQAIYGQEAERVSIV